MKKDCVSSLYISNEVLSCIPPYAMHQRKLNKASNEAKDLYVDMFLNSNKTVLQRIRESWLLDMQFMKDFTDIVPLAIQIELYFCDPSCGVQVSPFICTYYLQFMCFHQMQQYDKRDRVLKELIEVATNIHVLQCGQRPFISLNIAGHCLLIAGRRNQARDMFDMSYELTQMVPPYHKYNSAQWYLQNFF